jgi:hypothetical protein
VSPNDAPVLVTFGVTFDYSRWFDETELGAAMAAPQGGLRDRLRRARTLEGFIDIAAEGAPTTRIVDELAPWVQNLCFIAVPRLAAGQATEVHYFSRSGTLHLRPDGERVELAGDRNPAALYELQPLMKALVDCGRRFIAFAEVAKGDDADYIGNLNYVRRFEASAVAASTTPS